MAIVYCNLGLIYEKREDLNRAEEMHMKALAIDENLGRQEGLANCYGNLGYIYKTRGDLRLARNTWIKSRDLFLRIGLLENSKKIQNELDELPLES